MLFPSLNSAILGLITVAYALPQPVADRRQASACENTATSRQCWGNFSIDTDYYDVTPDTGVTREVSWTHEIILQLMCVADTALS